MRSRSLVFAIPGLLKRLGKMVDLRLGLGFTSDGGEKNVSMLPPSLDCLCWLKEGNVKKET